MPGLPEPGAAAPLPVWPFPTRAASQFRRVDQGWDLQYPGSKPVPVLAVEAGTLHNAGPDPGGFGPGYPLLVLDHPALGRYPAVYYGHTFTDMAKVGQHVAPGTVIGHTGGPHSGGNAYADPNWLEIGFWDNGPVARGTSGISAAGKAMRDWLEHGAQSATTPTSPYPSFSLFSIPGEITSAFASLDTLLKDAMWLADPANWVRIVAAGFGVILLIAGLVMLGKAA